MAEVKKIIVFGATGKTGLAVLRCALMEKLEVTAYVRTPSNIPEEMHKDITIIKGDIFDPKKVAEALEGQDAVISALGPRNLFGKSSKMPGKYSVLNNVCSFDQGDSQVLTQGVGNIISAMKQHGIKKLCAVSGDERFRPGAWRYALMKPFTVAADHGRHIFLLNSEKDSIDWIAMAAPRILDDMTVNPGYMVEKGKSPGEYVVNTGELADFMVKTLKDEAKFQEYRHTFVGISSRPKTKWF